MRFVAALSALALSVAVLAEPVARAKADDGTVTLHNESCQLAEVANLPGRATWEEKGKVFEGCFGVRAGLVMFFFSDKTVVVMSVREFASVRNI